MFVLEDIQPTVELLRKISPGLSNEESSTLNSLCEYLLAIDRMTKTFIKDPYFKEQE